MPSVPRYNQPQVQQAAAPNVRVNQEASVEAFGGGQAARGIEAVRGLGNTAMDIALKEQQKADDISMGAIAAEAKKQKLDILHNPETGALAHRGKNAFGLPEQVGERWGKSVESIIANAPNDRVRESARKFLQSEGLDLNEKIQIHIGREREAYDSAVTNDLVQTSQNDALLNYNNPQRLSDNINLGRAAIAKEGMRKGVPVEHIMDDYESKIHVGVIDQYINDGKDLSAKAYFEKNRERFGSRIDDAEKTIEAGSLRGNSQRITDKIMSSYSDLSTARAAVAEQIKEPRLRDAVDERLQKEFRLRDEAVKVDRDSLFLDAYNTVSREKTMDAVKPSVLHKLLPSQQKALEGVVGRDPAQRDDPAVYLKYVSMKPGPLSKLSEADLVQNVRPYVTDASFKEISRRWRDNRDGMNGDQKAADKFKSIFNEEEMIQNALISANVLTPATVSNAKNGKDSNAAEALLGFRNAVNDEFQSYFRANGKNPPDDVRQKIIDKMLLKKVYVDNVFSSPIKPVGSLTYDEKEKAFTPFSQISVSDKAAIVRQFRSRGKEPTKDQIEKAHGAYLINNKRRFEEIIGEADE